MTSDLILSESLIKSNAESQSLRDPFQQARNAYEAKQGQSETVLSSSPFSPSDNNVIENQQPQMNSMAGPDLFRDSMKMLGLDNSGISFNSLGKVQLLGRIQNKFGDNYQSNKDVMSLLQLFDSKLGDSANDKQMNKSITNANRTIGALFGG